MFSSPGAGGWDLPRGSLRLMTLLQVPFWLSAPEHRGGMRMSDSIEPLVPRLWFERIEKVAGGHLGSVENALRHTAHLLQLTPTPFRNVVRLGIDEERFEALLEAGDFDAAARHLVGQPTALSVQADREESKFRATISCSILGRAISGSGETVASAILDAWTTCLLGLRLEYGADLLCGPRQLEHRCRAG